MDEWVPNGPWEQVMWAAYALRARGRFNPRPSEIAEFLADRGITLTPQQISKARDGLFRKYGGWEGMVAEGQRRAAEPISKLLEKIAERAVSAEARALAAVSGSEPFAGSLCRIVYGPAAGPFERDEIEIVFRPENFPNEPTSSFDRLHQRVSDGIGKILRDEIDEFIDVRGVSRLGANNLRTLLEHVLLRSEDFHGDSRTTGIRRLKLAFGPMDWWHIQAFNNRMLGDEAFRTRMYAGKSARWALPPCGGEVPGYVCAHIILTGPDYLVLGQRPAREKVIYFPNRWTASLEENMQGPREIVRAGIRRYEPGDIDLHAAAYRGLSEELGLRLDFLCVRKTEHCDKFSWAIESPMAGGRGRACGGFGVPGAWRSEAGLIRRCHRSQTPWLVR